MSNNEYNYDFSYSVAFDSIPIQETNNYNDLEKHFMEWHQILSAMHVITDSQNSKSSNLLFKLPVFKKIGLQLLSLSSHLHGEVIVEDKQHQIQKLRELIYSSLQQLQQVLGRDKQKYINTIIMCLYAIIQRTVQDFFEIQDQFAIFHTIYWQIKGQLTNKQTMQLLIRKTLKVQQFHKFMYQSKESLQQRYLKQKQKQKINAIEPLTFRSSMAGSKNNMMYQSFKQLSMSRSGMGLLNQTKQNCQLNKILFQKQQNKNGKNIDTFRKKPQYSELQRQRPVYAIQKTNIISPILNQQQERLPAFKYQTYQPYKQSQNQHVKVHEQGDGARNAKHPQFYGQFYRQ